MLKTSHTPAASEVDSTVQRQRAEKQSAALRAQSLAASSLAALNLTVQAFRDAGVEVREQKITTADSELPARPLSIQQCLTEGGIAFEIKLAEYLVEKKFSQHPGELSRIAALRDFGGDTRNAKLSCASSFSAFIQEINHAIASADSSRNTRAFSPRAYKTETLLPQESIGFANAAKKFFGVKPAGSKVEQLARGIGLSDLGAYTKDRELVTECAKAEAALRQDVAATVAESLTQALSLPKDTLGLHIVRISELVTLIDAAPRVGPEAVTESSTGRSFMGLPGAALGVQDKIEIQFQLAAEADMTVPRQTETLMAAKRFVEAANSLAKEFPLASVHLAGESGQSSNFSHDPKKNREVGWRRARASLILPVEALPTLLPRLIHYITGSTAAEIGKGPSLGVAQGIGESVNRDVDPFSAAADFDQALRRLAVKG